MFLEVILLLNHLSCRKYNSSDVSCCLDFVVQLVNVEVSGPHFSNQWFKVQTGTHKSK